MSRAAFVVTALSLIAAESSATPVVWSGAGGNGHMYEFVRLYENQSWEQANEAAGDSTLTNGGVGYLATISSAEEQAFILSAVLPNIGLHKNQAWIGGRQDAEPIHPSTGMPTTPTAGWQWIANEAISPESWSYTNWLNENEPDGEPRNYGSIDERFLTMWVHFYEAGTDRRGTWNDERNNAPAAAKIIGMIVEWSVPGVPGVPEPATAALSALGLALLALHRRRA